MESAQQHWSVIRTDEKWIFVEPAIEPIWPL
jgi:hypothetical protein